MSERPPFTVHRFFAGLAETTFEAELGVVDPPMIDYLTDLLVRFVRSDVVNRMRGITGRPLMSVEEMTAEAAMRLGSARRELHRQIGDFTLFWAGVFPEALRQGAGGPLDQFTGYCQQGKVSYHIASQTDPESADAPDGDLLERLSRRFELCCYGLREVRRHWEEGTDPSGPGSLLLT